MMQENAFDDGASLQDIKQFHLKHSEQNPRADTISSLKRLNLKDSFSAYLPQLEILKNPFFCLSPLRLPHLWSFDIIYADHFHFNL